MTSLADVLKKKQERSERADRPKIDYFGLAKNNPARIRFLQEIDPDAPNYEAAKGSAVFLVEHVSPQTFQRKALCTFETEGRCFACEMNQEQPKEKWWAKTSMYVNVFDALDNKVKVLSRPAPGTFFDPLFEWAADENDGSVIGPTFKITKGANKTDPWTFTTTKNELDVPDSLDLFEVVGITVEYDKQRSFYLPNGNEIPVEAEEPKSKQDEDNSW